MFFINFLQQINKCVISPSPTLPLYSCFLPGAVSLVEPTLSTICVLYAKKRNLF